MKLATHTGGHHPKLRFIYPDDTLATDVVNADSDAGLRMIDQMTTPGKSAAPSVLTSARIQSNVRGSSTQEGTGLSQSMHVIFVLNKGSQWVTPPLIAAVYCECTI